MMKELLIRATYIFFVGARSFISLYGRIACLVDDHVREYRFLASSFH